MSGAGLARLGVAAVYEANVHNGLVDADLVQVIPGRRVAGPPRISSAARSGTET